MSADSIVVKGEFPATKEDEALSVALPAHPDDGLSDAEKAEIDRKLVWRLDMALIPWLCFLYLIAFLDRTNIGNAKIAKLTTEVPMSNSEYNLSLTIFFISYATFEAINNVLLKLFRPSVFLPCTMILWGLSMLGMGFITNWSGLMAARFFLGMTEAGLFPGVNYLLSCWYRRDEIAIRMAVFFSAAALSGSFGGLLAAAIQKMDGLGGYSGWRWIFIIEGILTIVVAFMSFWLVHDFPDDATFLSEADRNRVLRRLALDRQSSARREEFKAAYIWSALQDWKTYVSMLIYMGPLMPLYSISLFLPTIISNLSFTDKTQIIRNQLLSVPPYAGGALATVAIGFISDRQRKRSIYNMMLAPVGIMGFTMLIASQQPGVQYAGTFLAVIGIYATIPTTIAWVANNVEGVYKRGIVLGIMIGWGNLNGIVSSNVWSDGPRFFSGHGICIAYLAVCLFGGSLLFHVLLSRENAKRRAGERNHLTLGKTESEMDLMGDRRPDFYYTL
ncbi:major facilitator superfamily domain-containing protein [Cercophora newfieldiana]|uniref:Major facilitator superfamily domain-containing protein n=1 Tax=Cercophora newfieldiana TaxID=92897 RepID=A0AA40CQ24_9PEZI|nr:major facilitator superfamily domain-containing protein [Cercophora newfieldiana]